MKNWFKRNKDTILSASAIALLVFAMSTDEPIPEATEPTETQTDIVQLETETQFEVTIEPSTNETVAEPSETTTEIETSTEIVEETETSTEIIEEPLFYLSEKERRIVERVVMGEAGAEPYEGQVLVAQCILNGCLKEDVQPSKLRKMYKYSGYKTNVSESVKKAVSAVFDSGYKITDEPILYFYAPKRCKGKWHETQRFVIELGGHRFFKEW
jgi:spore germination cell wall hydrolase CwlJ-like protein